MVDAIAVGRRQVGAHGPVVAGDDDAAAARRMLLVDVVLGAESDLLRGVPQGVGILVLADGADKDDGVGGQDVLPEY
jgi:hypothetical protein